MTVLRSICAISIATALGCGTSPVSPSPAATAPAVATLPSVAGSWTGSYVPLCPNSPSCGWVGGGPVDEQAFVLVLQQDGTAISGQIRLNDWWLTRVAAVSGTIAADGAMTLQGGDSWPQDAFCRPAGGWNIVSWNGRYDRATDAIAGTFSFVTQKHLSSCYYDPHLNVDASRMSLRHGAGAETTLSGHWQGSYTIVKCTPVGWPTCTPDASGSDVPLDLQLTQNGMDINGTITRIPWGIVVPLRVNGSVVSKSSVSALIGSYSDDMSPGHTARLTDWSTTIDSLGVMQGTFRYIDEWRWTTGPNAGQTWSTAYDAKLRNVIQVPW
jgi:hypothetical protein